MSALLKYRHNSKGFTLVELLIVVGVLAVLLAIVLIAVNPARQFSKANNTQRRSDVNAILNGIYQYAGDNKGALPSAITTSVLIIKSGAGGADLCSALTPTYIAQIPIDPTTGTYTDCTSYNTSYTVTKNSSNRVTVAATGELSETISVTR